MNTNYICRSIEKYVEMYTYVHIYHTYDVSLCLSGPLIKVAGSASDNGVGQVMVLVARQAFDDVALGREQQSPKQCRS